MCVGGVVFSLRRCDQDFRVLEVPFQTTLFIEKLKVMRVVNALKLKRG